jgi:hypothetical protein
VAQGKDRGRGNKPFCRPSTGIQAALLLARWGKALRHTFMYRLCPGSSCLASAGGIVSFIAVVSRVRAPGCVATAVQSYALYDCTLPHACCTRPQQQQQQDP